MTGVVNKFQRILGLKAPQGLRYLVHIPEAQRPVVFVTHMEQLAQLLRLPADTLRPPRDTGGRDFAEQIRSR
jgi:hypothetical protein